MKKIISLLLAVLLCANLAFCVCAAVYDGDDSLLLIDDAGLLTAAEAEALRTKLETVSHQYGAQVCVCTVASLEGADANDFVNDCYDQLGFGYGAEKDGVLLLVSMDPREYRILSNGFAGTAIDTDTIELIGDMFLSDLSDGYYADAFHTYADECAYYLNGYLNGFPFDAGATLVTCLIVGLIIGLIVALVLKGQLKSVRAQNQANSYIKAGSMQVTVQNDLYLYRTVTRTKRETSSSGSSRGGGSSRSVGGGSF